MDNEYEALLNLRNKTGTSGSTANLTFQYFDFTI